MFMLRDKLTTIVTQPQLYWQKNCDLHARRFVKPSILLFGVWFCHPLYFHISLRSLLFCCYYLSIKSYVWHIAAIHNIFAHLFDRKQQLHSTIYIFLSQIPYWLPHLYYISYHLFSRNFSSSFFFSTFIPFIAPFIANEPIQCEEHVRTLLSCRHLLDAYLHFTHAKWPFYIFIIYMTRNTRTSRCWSDESERQNGINEVEPCIARYLSDAIIRVKKRKIIKFSLGINWNVCMSCARENQGYTAITLCRL